MFPHQADIFRSFVTFRSFSSLKRCAERNQIAPRRDTVDRPEEKNEAETVTMSKRAASPPVDCLPNWRSRAFAPQKGTRSEEEVLSV